MDHRERGVTREDQWHSRETALCSAGDQAIAAEDVDNRVARIERRRKKLQDLLDAAASDEHVFLSLGIALTASPFLLRAKITMRFGLQVVQELSVAHSLDVEQRR